IVQLREQHATLDAKWTSYEALFGEACAWFKEPCAYGTLTKGKIDLYKAFVERFVRLVRTGGKVGILCPSSIYTDETSGPLRELLFGHLEVECLYCLSNERYMFANVHHAFRIVALCAHKGGTTTSLRAAFAIDVRQALSLQE